MQLCGYSSRIVSLLGMGVHSPLLNMLPLRIPTWVPQDSVYLVTNIRVAQSRMPRPRYNQGEILRHDLYSSRLNDEVGVEGLQLHEKALQKINEEALQEINVGKYLGTAVTCYETNH